MQRVEGRHIIAACLAFAPFPFQQLLSYQTRCHALLSEILVFITFLFTREFFCSACTLPLLLLDKLFCHCIPVASDSSIFHYYVHRPPTSMLFG